MSNKERVLVVDEVSDTAEVLQAVLEPRGLTVNRVRRLDRTCSPASDSRPAVVVFDAESMDGPFAPGWDGWQHVPQVIIGKVRVADASSGESTDSTPQRLYLQKPFQFAELVQAIESLIAGRRPRVFPRIR